MKSITLITWVIICLFENNLFHSARLTRTYDLMDPEDLFDLKGLKLETNNKIKVVDSENIIQTKLILT